MGLYDKFQCLFAARVGFFAWQMSCNASKPFPGDPSLPATKAAPAALTAALSSGLSLACPHPGHTAWMPRRRTTPRRAGEPSTHSSVELASTAHSSYQHDDDLISMWIMIGPIGPAH